MLKKRNLKATLLAILFTIATSATFAQKGTIEGTVLDAVTTELLIGTTILIEGTTISAATDAEGGFTISNITPGRVTITAHYLGYEVFRQTLDVEADKVTTIRIPLRADGINISDVIVVAQINNESENVLLLGQKQALVATQSVGAAEMSRKGIGNAQAAVSQVSGISKQEGVKNVFVRGLGDRYNTTFLNGFPLPSEDPEYKNIDLEFFGSDIIQNIGVNKVFSASNGGDVGGAVIDIRSKELLGTQALSVSLGGGINSASVSSGSNFLKQDGVNYFGTSRTARPSEDKFNFANKLDPSTVHLPLNHSYGISGGKRWNFGEKNNPLSFFVVATHSTDYSYTDETVRKSTANGETVFQDQQGKKSTIDINQLVLGNVDFKLDNKHSFTYNFMLVHANNQYVGQYQGYLPELNQGTENGEAFLRRQQSNDNLLLTHQLMTTLNLANRWQVNIGAAYNTIKGLEPDRRENYLSLLDNGQYTLVAGNRQKRFFSQLDEQDLNIKASVSYELNENLDIEKSNVTIGYRGRLVDDGFSATEYNIGASPGFFSADNLQLDEIYNSENYTAGKFTLFEGRENRYDVHKNVHSAYVEATHQLTKRLAANIGFQVDYVDMAVDYNVETVPPGVQEIKKPYYLPSLSLRYDLADKHSLRLGLSKSYTLPQSKEIAPYQYINIGFSSEGNPNLKPSDNYNADLKWDWYPSNSELIAVGAFYKHIVNPIGRVDIGGSAGLLSYNNIGEKANVAGVEFEMRKNIFNISNTTGLFRGNRLTLGLNLSYIYSDLEFDVENTDRRRTQLESASPFLLNADLSYNHTWGAKVLNASVIVNWFNSRIHTLGTRGYRDIIEEGIATLSFVSSFKANKYMTLQLKASNLLNPAHRLTRDYASREGKIILGEYRKGVEVSVGVSFDF